MWPNPPQASLALANEYAPPQASLALANEYAFNLISHVFINENNECNTNMDLYSPQWLSHSGVYANN